MKNHFYLVWIRGLGHKYLSGLPAQSKKFVLNTKDLINLRKSSSGFCDCKSTQS